MALGPINNLGAPPQPAPARTISDAQRAFFQAALGKVEAAAPVAAAPPQPAPEPERQAPAAPAETPKAVYRPGSLLDIKI